MPNRKCFVYRNWPIPNSILAAIVRCHYRRRRRKKALNVTCCVRSSACKLFAVIACDAVKTIFFYHFQQNENKQNNKPPTIYHAIGHFAPANPLNNDLKNRAKNSSNILASLAQDAQHACFRFVYLILWFYHRGGTPSSPTVTIKHLLNCFILFRSVDKALFIIITATCEMRASERAEVIQCEAENMINTMNGAYRTGTRCSISVSKTTNWKEYFV